LFRIFLPYMFIYLVNSKFSGMVISDKGFKRKGGAHVHLCGVCGAGFLNLEEALVCEEGHKGDVGSSGDAVVDDVVVETRGSKHGRGGSKGGPSSVGLVKYGIVVREAFRGRVHNFFVEAPDIRAAADVVRDRFPHHNGYEIKTVG